MAGMFGGSAAQKVTRYTSVDIQTSALGVAIPILYGRNKIGSNIVWLNNFKSRSSSSAGKGGGGKGGSSYEYSCAVIFALCEGPISDIVSVRYNNTDNNLGQFNLELYAGAASQSPASWITSKYPAEAMDYARTAYIFSDYLDMGSSASLPNFDWIADGLLANSATTLCPDANPADIIADGTYGFITSEQFGADPDAGYIDSTSLATYKAYCQAQGIWLSPYLRSQEQGTQTLQRWAQLTNSWIFWSGSKLKFVPLGVVALSGQGATYTPQLTPIYNLGVDDMIATDDKGTLVTVTRIDPADGYNKVEIDNRDGSVSYDTSPNYWEDQVSIEEYGQLQSQTITADEITNPTIASRVAALVGWRSVYIRNNYSFKTGYSFIALEPGDIVSLTDPGIGLSLTPVRITEVQEDEKGELQFKAEECPSSAGIAALFPSASQAGNPGPNWYISPGNVNAPLFLQPPTSITGGVQQIWIGASGGTYWGGCTVWASSDGNNYAAIGQISAGVAQGSLTAALAQATGTDTTHTLAVDLTESDGGLSTSVTSANAQALETVAVVDGEAIAYGAVATTGSYTYSLTYLIRGVYGTTPAAHASGAPVSVVDSAAMLKYAIPAQYVGKALYFKFTSRNIFGNAEQDLSEVSAYQCTADSTGVAALFASLGAGVSADLGVVSDAVSGTADAGAVGGAVTYSVDLGGLS